MATSSPFTPTQLGASAADAISTLSAVGERGEALVQAWVQAANAAAVLEASERASGAARKAARRGLNVLKSRGIAIPDPRREDAPSQAATSEELAALMLAPDGSGVVLLVIYSRSDTGKTRATFVLLRDGEGIVRIENGGLSQSRIKEQIRRAFPNMSYDPVPVPLGWARSRIAAARSVHKQRGLIEPLGFDTAAPLLTPAPETAPAHPFDEEGFELSGDDARDLTSDSGRLHQLPEFRGWFPPSPEVDALLRKLGARMTPGQTPEAEALSGWIKEEVGAATDRFFTPEQREILVGRLKDAGVSVLAREGEQTALQVAALIQIVSKAGLVTDPPQSIGFLRAFFEKALTLLARQNRGNLPLPVTREAPAAAEPVPPAES